MAASNAEVIESLKIEIDVGIRGQAKLDRFTERLTTLSTALTDVNQKLAEYARLAGSVGSFRIPRITGGSGSSAAAGSSIGKTEVGKVASQAQEATSSMQQLATATKSVNQELGKTSSAAKKAGDSAKKSTSHFGNLLKTFIKIAKYRAIRAVLRTITEGFRTGIQNLARYSSDFNDTMSQFSTSTLYLKNALGTLAKPIIELLVPALQKVIEWIVKAINKVNEFIAALKGEGTYTAAKVYFVDYAKELDKSAKKAKELKNTLMGFDEINRLDGNNEDTSNEQDYSKMFEERTVSEGVQVIADKVRDMLEAIKDKLKGIGEAFKDFWEKVKENIPQEVIEHFKEAWDRLRKAIENLSTSPAWGKIKDFLAAIVGFSLGAIIEGLADLMDLISSILEFIADPSWKTFKEMIHEICDSILSLPDYIETWIKPKIDESSLPEWAKKVLHGVVDGLITALKITFPIAGAADWIRKLIESKEPGKEVLVTLGFAIAPWAAGLWDTFEKVFKSEHPVKDVLVSLGFAVAPWAIGIWETISDPKKYKPMLITLGFAFAPGAMIAWENLKNNFSSIKEAWETLVEEFEIGVENALNDIFNLEEDISDFAAFFYQIFGGLKQVGEDVVGTIIGVLDDLFDFTEKKKSFEDFINYIWLQLKNLFDKIKIPHFSWGPDTIDVPAWVQTVLDFLHIPAGIPKLHIDWYAQGGFPEDGLFMANHTELVGKFSNGKTAVANNEQIEAGIEEAAYRGFARAMSGNNGGTYTFIAQLNGKTIFEEVVKQNNQETRQKGFNRLATI